MSSTGAFAARAGNGMRVLFFDAGGRFAREFGVAGDGPGEFRRIVSLQFTAGDSLLVIEAHRYHVFTPALKLARTVPLSTQVVTGVLQPDGSLVAEMRIRTPEAAGYPAHLLDRAGRLVRSFGWVKQPAVDPRCTSCDLHLQPGMTSGQVILTPVNRYEWEVWTARGELAERYSVTASPWFRPWREAGNWATGETPMPTVLKKVIPGPAGQFWILANSAPPDWKPRDHAVDSHVKRLGASVLAPNRATLDAYTLAHEETDIQTIVEVIDARRQSVIATARFPGDYSPLSWSHVARVRALPDGDYVIDVFRFTLLQQ